MAEAPSIQPPAAARPKKSKGALTNEDGTPARGVRAARRLRRRLFGDAADEDVTTPLAPREHASVLGCPSAIDGACLTLPDIAVQDVTDAQGAAAMAAALQTRALWRWPTALLIVEACGC